MAITKALLEQGKKAAHVVVEIQHQEIGKDENNFPLFKIVYEKKPTNFKLVRLFEHINCAVLEDLDYPKTNEI